MVDNKVVISLKDSLEILGKINASINKMKSSNDMMISRYQYLRSAINDDGYDIVQTNLTKTKALIEEAIQHEEILVSNLQAYINNIAEAIKDV